MPLAAPIFQCSDYCTELLFVYSAAEGHVMRSCCAGNRGTTGRSKCHADVWMERASVARLPADGSAGDEGDGSRSRCGNGGTDNRSKWHTYVQTECASMARQPTKKIVA
jgi:hypothetical protein